VFKVAIVSTKGGVGKTTTAAYLGLALNATVMVDTDPAAEGSLAAWAKDAGPSFPKVIEAAQGQVPKKVFDGPGAAIIDTAPGITDGLSAMLQIADFLILPTRPGRADLERTSTLIHSLADAGRRGLVLLTHTRATSVTRQAVRLLESQSGEFVLYPVSVPLAVRFENAFGTIPRDLTPFDQLAADLKGLIK